MEQNNWLKMGLINKGEEVMMKLPIGFRFRPTDEELVVHYLKRRVMSLPLPASVIPDIHLRTFDPWSLPGDLKEKRCYFWKRNGELRNKCSKVMPTTSGFWKSIGKVKQIMSQGLGAPNDVVVGLRKSWTFYSGKTHFHGCFSKTRWRMHEFRLVNPTQNVICQGGEWVVCCIFQRKVRHKDHGAAPKHCASYNLNCELEIDNPSFIDFKMENNVTLGPPLPSSPCSTTD